MQNESAKLTSLNVLRGAAILFVIIAHFAPPQAGRGAPILFGNAGVILFFFLSGFLMDQTLNQDGNLTSYALRRAFRILPMYWVSLLLVATSTRDWTFGQILANATFTAPAVGSERMLGVYWTLYIEALFYYLVPLLALGGRHVIHSATYIALALFAAFALVHGVEKGAGFYLIFCLCGVQIGAWHRGELSAPQIWLSVATVCAGASLLMPAGSIYLSPVSNYLGPVAFGCAILLVAGLRLPWKSPVLEFPGKISYSWYLLHSIFGYQLVTYLEPSWYAIPAGVTFTFALSILTYRFVEAPAVAFGRFLCGGRDISNSSVRLRRHA